MRIAGVILELSILDIQTMLLFMVKTHLGQVKTMLQPPQAQINTTILFICIATTGILVSPMIANTTAISAIIATAEAE
jgi:hypothetical protein